MRRRGILEFMKKCITDPAYDTSVSGNARLIELIKKLLHYFFIHYGLKDIEENGKHKHQLWFYLLYLDDNTMSFDDISGETLADISFDTFRHHVRNYNRTMIEYLREESNLDPDMALLLSAYETHDK